MLEIAMMLPDDRRNGEELGNMCLLRLQESLKDMLVVKREGRTLASHWQWP